MDLRTLLKQGITFGPFVTEDHRRAVSPEFEEAVIRHIAGSKPGARRLCVQMLDPVVRRGKGTNSVRSLVANRADPGPLGLLRRRGLLGEWMSDSWNEERG